MGKRDDFEERLLRLNGKRPTARDRWRAFSRLWRLAHRHGVYQDMAATECFQVLYADWRYVWLLDEERGDGLVDRSHIPTFLRKRLLAHHKKQRLYAGHYEWVERDKKVANLCRDVHGIEVTPTEVAEVRRKVINLARSKAVTLGVRLPADDEDVLRLLKEGTHDAG